MLLHSVMSWGDEQSDVYEDAIDNALRSLSVFPEMGRPRDDLFAGCRSLPVEHHVIYYEADDRAVTIIRFLHQRMDARGRVKN